MKELHQSQIQNYEITRRKHDIDLLETGALAVDSVIYPSGTQRDSMQDEMEKATKLDQAEQNRRDAALIAAITLGPSAVAAVGASPEENTDLDIRIRPDSMR